MTPDILENELKTLPEAERVRIKGETQYVTALEIPSVESPITVVRAAIVAEAKGKKC